MGETDSTLLMLGELKGQLREIIHSFNNLAMKFEGVARSVDNAAHIPAKVDALEVRVSALEASENQRKGAVGFTTWVLKVLPAASIGAGFAAAWKLLG